MRLENRVAIVTGGGVGIGKEYSKGLAAEGAKVVIADINFEAAQATAKEIEQQGKEALPLRIDVSEQKSTLEMAEKAMERFGRIDILVNNAALLVALGPAKSWEEISIEEWDRVMAVNLRGMFLCCRAVVPHMRAQGKGKIVNVSSTSAYRGFLGRLHYAASKAGVLGFTRALARELAGQDINVNAIAPGFTLSEGVMGKKGKSISEEIEHEKSIRCIQKAMYPKDLVGTVIFLASDDSDFICGETIIVDGGIAFI